MLLASYSPRSSYRVADGDRDKARDGIHQKPQALIPVTGNDEAGNAEPRRKPHRRPYDIREEPRFQGLHPQFRYRLKYTHLQDIPRLPQISLRHRYSGRHMHRERRGSPGITRRGSCRLNDEGDPRIEEHRPDGRELFLSGNLDKEDVIRGERWVQVVIIAKIRISLITDRSRIFGKTDITDPADRYSLTISRTTTRAENDGLRLRTVQAAQAVQAAATIS